MRFASGRCARPSGLPSKRERESLYPEALASALEWSGRKRTSARPTIGSPNRSRPGDENLGPKSGRSSSQIGRSEEHTSELQSPCNLVCRLLLEKKKKKTYQLES